MSKPKSIAEVLKPIAQEYQDYFNSPEYKQERLAYLLGQSATLNQLRLKITDELIAVQKEIRNLESKGK